MLSGTSIDKLISAVSAIGKDHVIVAIDGRCAAGKTTLGDTLSRALSAPVIHMDHFFLRPEQRTASRLAEPGGNIDRERFLDEVLIPLRETGECTYRRFDCSTGVLRDPVVIPKSSIHIVEGSYSCHPAFFDFYDLRLFMTVDPAEQLLRIAARNGDAAKEIFRTKWIPMEEKYFEHFSIGSKADIIIS